MSDNIVRTEFEREHTDWDLARSGYGYLNPSVQQRWQSWERAERLYQMKFSNLQAQIAMKDEALHQFVYEFIDSGTGEISKRLIIADGKRALSATAESSEKWLREHDAEVQAKALEDLFLRYHFFGSTEGKWLRAAIEADIAALRAKNGG